MTDKINNLASQAPRPGDPHLEGLLDDLLAPKRVAGPVPVNLVDDVIAATEPLIRRRRHVLVRLNDLWWPRALAASIVILASTGIVLTMASIVQDAQDWVSLTRDLPAVLHSVDNQQSVAMVPVTDLDAQTHALDRDLSQLETEVKQADMSAQVF